MSDKDYLKISGVHDRAYSTVFKNAAYLRKNMTDPEKRLWEALKAKRLGFKFRRQHPIGVYVLDFYCHQLRISIEVDGGYHLNIEQKTKDKARTEYLESVGITEYRFTNEDITECFDDIIVKIQDILQNARRTL